MLIDAKECSFRDIYKKLFVIYDDKFVIAQMNTYFRLSPDVNGALMYGYISHGSVAVEIMAGASITPDNGVQFTKEFDFKVVLGMHQLSGVIDIAMNDNLYINLAPKLLRIDVNFCNDPILEHLRSLVPLDRYRDKTYPDNMKVYLLGNRTEDVMIKMENFNRGSIRGKLLFNSKSFPKIKKGDFLEFKPLEQEDGKSHQKVLFWGYKTEEFVSSK